MTVDTVGLDIPSNFVTNFTEALTNRAPTICPCWKSVRSDIMVDQHNKKTITGLLFAQTDSGRIIGQGKNKRCVQCLTV